MASQTTILVLGMHRSGTSAIMRVLNLLGVELGEDLLPAQEDNETGFWEHADIVGINNRILESFHSSWDDPFPLPPFWWEQKHLAPLGREILDVIERDFRDVPLWGLKDARLCRLLPFWDGIFETLGIEAKSIIVIRNPDEVAGSLKKRNDFPEWKSHHLWLTHALEAEEATRNRSRYFLIYQDLLQDWQHTVERAGNALSVEWPHPPASIQDEVGQFLKPDLRHNLSSDRSTNADTRISAWVKEAYQALLQAGQGESPQEIEAVFTRLRESLSAAESLFLPWQEELHRQIDGLNDSSAAFNETVIARDKTVDQMSKDLTEINQALQEANVGINARDGQIALLTAQLEGYKAEAEASLRVRLRRWVLSPISRFVKFFVGRHTVRMVLEPRADLTLEGEKYRSVGEDPYFLIRPQKGSMPKGWTFFKFLMDVEEGNVAPKLFFDVGHGFSEYVSIQLFFQIARRNVHLIRIPYHVTQIRLDPMDSKGKFTLKEVEFEEIGILRTLLFLLRTQMAAVPPGRLMHLPWKALLILKREGIRGIKERLVQGNLTTGRFHSFDDWIRFFDTLSDENRRSIAHEIERMSYKPLISVVMPVFNPEEQWLRLALDSVLNQIYPHWELCIADDASTLPHVRRVLEEYQVRDSRIKVVFRERNGHISAASNSAIELVTGEFIALLDHDDELREHALYMVAEELNRHSDADIIYSDEDKIDQHGKRSFPHFKSDWNPDLFYSQNFLNHLTVYRAALIFEVNGFREGFEGAQDFDLALRVVENTVPERIRHLPHILYHWRSVPGSAAMARKEKEYAQDAAAEALKSHFKRLNRPAEVKSGILDYRRVSYPVADPKPLVSLIIPTRDRVDLLRGCVEGILNETDYRNLEVIIMDNESEKEETHAFFEKVQQDQRVKVIPFSGPFNFSAINNEGVRQSSGEIVGLINNDLKVIEPYWLTEMVGHALRPEVGATGANLYFPNDTIQHAGVILGLGGVAGHSHKHLPRVIYGYVGRAKLTQNLSAVSAACMLLRREVFEEVGGLDAENLAVAFNDVDLSLKIREKGYLIVWTPYAELYHLESASRLSDHSSKRSPLFIKEIKYMKSKWGDSLLSDPYYNPNLTLANEQFGLAFPPRTHKPWNS